jgi:hypothetical protein
MLIPLEADNGTKIPQWNRMLPAVEQSKRQLVAATARWMTV